MSRPFHRIDYFSDTENRYQAWFASARNSLLGHYLLPLKRYGVNADHITLLGLLFLIPYAYFFLSRPLWAVGFLVGAIILDGLDGVYARATGTANAGGALTDVCADQVGMVVTTLLLIHYGLVDDALAAYYAIAYVTMVALSVWQNSLGVPLQIVIRSKYPLYAMVAAWALTGYNGFAWLMALFSVTMTWSAFQSFFRLKHHFAGLYSLADPRTQRSEPANPRHE